MSGPVRTMSQVLRRFWRAGTKLKSPAVVVHDPAAARAHDLDNPYFDNKIQTRMADVIADAGHKK
jgi:hypothetical protein